MQTHTARGAIETCSRLFSTSLYMAGTAATNSLLLSLPFLKGNDTDTPSFGEYLFRNRNALWNKKHVTKRDQKCSDKIGEGKPKFESKKPGDNFQVHFGWTATPQNSKNAKYFHLALKGNSSFSPVSESDLKDAKKTVKRLPLPYYRAATKDEKTKLIIEHIITKVAPYVQAIIEETFPQVYAKMRKNAKSYRYPARSIFTSGTISFMFAKNTGQRVVFHMDEKDAKGTVGVSINEIVGTVEGGNLVIDIPGHERLTVPANHAAVAAFKDLLHAVHAPTGGDGCRVSIILQQNEEVVLSAEREELGLYLRVSDEEKKKMVVDGRLAMNDNEIKRYGNVEEAARRWGLTHWLTKAICDSSSNSIQESALVDDEETLKMSKMSQMSKPNKKRKKTSNEASRKAIINTIRKMRIQATGKDSDGDDAVSDGPDDSDDAEDDFKVFKDGKYKKSKIEYDSD